MQAAASPHLEVTFPHSRSFPLRASVLLTPKLYPWHERGSRRVVESAGSRSGGIRGQSKTKHCSVTNPNFMLSFDTLYIFKAE